MTERKTLYGQKSATSIKVLRRRWLSLAERADLGGESPSATIPVVAKRFATLAPVGRRAILGAVGQGPGDAATRRKRAVTFWPRAARRSRRPAFRAVWGVQRTTGNIMLNASTANRSRSVGLRESWEDAGVGWDRFENFTLHLDPKAEGDADDRS
jgi:hypothetical protein